MGCGRGVINLLCQLREVLRRPSAPRSLVTMGPCEGLGPRGWGSGSEPSPAEGGQVAHGATCDGPREFEGCVVALRVLPAVCGARPVHTHKSPPHPPLTDWMTPELEAHSDPLTKPKQPSLAQLKPG